MLVLSRKNQESVVVVGPHNNECLFKITLFEIQGRRVKLAFEAEDDVLIQRSELWEQMHTGSPPRNELPNDDTARREATDRWEDDGGETDRNRSTNGVPMARA